MKRRDFLKYSFITSAVLFGCGATNSSSSLKYSKKQLPIPELLEGELRGGVKHYDLTVKKARHEFFDGILTDTYAINSQTFLAPTLLLKDGETVSLNFTNNLTENTTMHSHGMHLPASMDGGVHQVIQPSETWSSTYTVNQRACTNWYHPHLMGETARQVYQGLAGVLIVEDNQIQTLDLPKRYGVDDIPLVLQDRVFDSNRQIDYSPSMMEIMRGYKGDYYLVNGAINPYLEVENKEIRFRVLNGSNSSVYNLGFLDGRSFKQIATDNSLLEAPVSLTRLKLSPGERAEIVVDFTNDKDLKLSLYEFDRSKEFLEIQVTKDRTLVTTTPQSLTTLTKLNPADSQNIRTFTLSGRMGSFTINGVSMNKNVINETIPVNQVEIWEVTNEMMMDHNFHIHATHFMLLERNGVTNAVSENEKGYKDTVFLPAGESVKFIVKMTDYTDNTNPYMYHCHFLEHEDRGMMGQFVVT